MPNILEIPINIKTGSFSRLTSSIAPIADLNDSGKTKHGHKSYSAMGSVIVINNKPKKINRKENPYVLPFQRHHPVRLAFLSHILAMKSQTSCSWTMIFVIGIHANWLRIPNRKCLFEIVAEPFWMVHEPIKTSWRCRTWIPFPKIECSVLVIKYKNVECCWHRVSRKRSRITHKFRLVAVLSN